MTTVQTGWADDPLSSAQSDTLNRRPYATATADLIARTHTFDSSIVFGLSGPWGSGKTSVINIILEQLSQSHPEWAVAHFTPWATSDTSSLLSEFYSSLAQALPAENRTKIKSALSLLARVAAPAATLIPLVGDSVSEGVKAASDKLVEAPSWQDAFQKASATLKELGRPVLVVVDDIDRLQAPELMLLLKVVRLLGRFPGVQYLLAYDDETLFRNLTLSASGSGDLNGSAERFMEKIVQYPLIVPPLLQHQQLALISNGLAKSIRTRTGDLDPYGRLNSLMDCFVELLRTPRAIARYLAQLQYHLPLIPGDEIDDEDVCLLVLVRVSAPSVFNLLPHHRDHLLTGHTNRMKTATKTLEFEKFELDELLKQAPRHLNDVLKKVLISLFPKTRADRQIAVYGTSNIRGVHNEEYFDRYFAMGIPMHDVSDTEVRRALRFAVAGDVSQLLGLVIQTDEERALLALSKAARSDLQPSNDVDRIALGTQVVAIVNRMPNQDAHPFSAHDRVTSWLGSTIAQLDAETSAGVVKDVMSRVTAVVDKILVWRRVEGAPAMQNRRDAVPGWFSSVQADLASEAASEFITHLTLGDRAPDDAGIGYQFEFALSNGQQGVLKREVGRLLESGQINLDALAARFVSMRTYLGVKPDWRLSSDTNLHGYWQIAPKMDDPWYALPVRSDVNDRDVSWKNRRLFAQGRFPKGIDDIPETEPGVEVS